MLEQCCNYSKQCRAKNRRCESSRVISPCKGSSSFTKWTSGLEQNHLYYESKVKEYFLCNTNVPVSVCSFFVFVKIISDKSRLTTFKIYTTTTMNFRDITSLRWGYLILFDPVLGPHGGDFDQKIF